jgi:hypothetical protein
VSAVLAADPQPESDEEFLGRMAALTTADLPPGEDWPDPEDDAGCPARYAHLTFPQIDALLAAQPAPVPEVWPAGCLPRDGNGRGAGFADGGALDTLAPGPVLGWCADRAHARLSALSDDELIGVLRGWSRQASWAQARGLGAVAELARRRPGELLPGEPPIPPGPGGIPAKLSEFLPDEIGMALTLTQIAAGTQLRHALELAARPATAAALEAGRIDLRKVRVILEAVAPLSGEHAAAVEAAVLPEAPGQTTGELRIAVTQAVLRLDPDAVRRRRDEAEKEAQVEAWTDPDGTATLAGRSLPPAEVLAADKRLCQVAAWWKKQIRAAWQRADPDGQLPRPEHGTDLLRARAYLALLLGQPLEAPPADLLPPAQDSGTGAEGPAGPGRTDPDRSGGPAQTGPDRPIGLDDQDVPAGLRRPGTGTDPVAGLPPLAGQIHLTLPIATLLDLSDHPGEAAGYGPLHADTARLLACALAGHRATRWQITLTAPDGTALATGTHRGPARTSGGGWTVQVTAEPIATVTCDHRNQEPGYRPSPALQRLVRARTCTCCGPGCRRPAGRADLDHTRAYDQGGRTDECDLCPGCRHCHRRKQAWGWQLAQPRPGVMIWTSPAGRRYTTLPSKHPT